MAQKIIVDVMGGDHAPEETVRGAIDAIIEYGDRAELILVGDRARISEIAAQQGADLDGVRVVHTDTFVTMEDALLYVTAEISGEKIGECVFAPYYFEIPKKHFGKEVTAALTFHSTLAPLFGDLDLWSNERMVLAFAGLPRSSPEKVDIAKLNVRGIVL